MNRLFHIGVLKWVFAVCVLAGCGGNGKGDRHNDVDALSSGSCKWEDGTYSATVDYHNPDTDFSNTYTLEVVVEDCQVIQINFPNGGWLDEDHISPADLDEDGNASVEGEEGKTYDVHLEQRNGS